MSRAGENGLLTLEPLIDAIRTGVEESGWELSGLQKTTSHQFEGRWEGESTRSAYLFFHAPDGPDFVSIDVYLDETTRGLTGNLALVVDMVPLGELGDAGAALHGLSTLSAVNLPADKRRPLTLRLRLDDAATVAGEADTEVRFKLRIPRDTIGLGAHEVCALAKQAVLAFEAILGSKELAPFTGPG